MNRHIVSRMLSKWKSFAASLALLGMLAVPIGTAAAAPAETKQQLEEVKNMLNELHISGKNVADSKYDTIDETIKSLDDPYTDFLDQDEWNDFINSLQLNYAGIGMRIGQDEGGIVAVEIFRESPAEAAGLRRGDYIIGIADKSTAGMRIEQVSGAIRGTEGTEIAIRVKRGEQEFEVKPKRAQIHLPVVSGGMMEGNIGYLNVDSFSEDADEKFAAMLGQLKSNDIKGLVVDLRDNPGGLLETAKHIAEQFISRGILIHTRDKNNVDEPMLIKNGQTVQFPVVILVNENSASASELLTAALQDNKKGIAVGVKTYGKGSVQALYELHSGGVLKVTVEEYLSPNKRTVNHKGVMPDINAEGTIPQLLIGVRSAGAAQIRLEVEKHSYRVNGIEFFDADISSLNLNDTVYLPARVLAASVGLPLTWDETVQGVRIGTGDASAMFDSSSGFLIERNIGYIDLSRFKELFPQMEWTADSQKTVLTVKGN